MDPDFLDDDATALLRALEASSDEFARAIEVVQSGVPGPDVYLAHALCRYFVDEVYRLSSMLGPPQEGDSEIDIENGGADADAPSAPLPFAASRRPTRCGANAFTPKVRRRKWH
ncbi:hypothetical protein PTE30175_04478 [Pandoraea terrae]|uniref:Uncharacterized protein n=1 Tax=Pandoraea terrae TaxID=1537710 RepID=A0A5E4YK43_9BURK|nr:hypothetical protein [Pandoraea terrae]VVE49099.1 hypothetical protein PTE30175_04478 [Pandoraea terrae]